jgi:hypothetical protein
MTASRLAATSLLLCSVLNGISIAGPVQKPARSETMALNLQDRAAVPGSTLDVHFVGYRDSRCPADLQCAWSGEASAFFWLTGGGIKPQIIAVPWDGSGQPDRHSTRVGPYRFYMQSLEPRPQHAIKVDPGQYKAVIKISL